MGKRGLAIVAGVAGMSAPRCEHEFGLMGDCLHCHAVEQVIIPKGSREHMLAAVLMASGYLQGDRKWSQAEVLATIQAALEKAGVP